LIGNSCMSLLLSGATGFLGSALASWLVDNADYRLVLALRRKILDPFPGSQSVVIGDLDGDTDWSPALLDIDVVIHTAARVHVMDESIDNPLTEFRKVNVEGTLNFARQAAAMGVKRFIYISSIKVNGELTVPGRPFTADDSPAPVDPYAISKWESEAGLFQIAEETCMEVVIIRPPLVYGPGVKANFQSMMCWISRGVPLPLGAIHNKRSLLALDNLVDLIVTCIKHPSAANQVFLASDGDDISTTELLKQVGNALGRSARLISIPEYIIIITARMLGKHDLSQRLLGSLQVDMKKTQDLLGWRPRVTVDEAIRKTAQAFIRQC